MNKHQTAIINRLRQEGKGYRTIAIELDLPLNSVKSWCRRHPKEEERVQSCLHCGSEITNPRYGRKRKFCSDSCRLKWWSEHPEKRAVKTVYTHVCGFCGRQFSNNRIKADYCSRRCFAMARSKENVDG